MNQPLRTGDRAGPTDPTPGTGPADPTGPTDPTDPTPGTGPRTPVSSRLIAWGPIVVPMVIVLIGAYLYRWVDEDAFIDFRIIDNLVAGHGFVFNLGERVEVSSDPLWLFSLAFFHEVLPFVALEWISVILGLICTGLGFLAGARAVQRLAFSRHETAVFPLGLLIVSVVAGVWEFATSGLEMSLVFLWLGTSFLLLVRVEARRNRAIAPAVVMGLGPLIRPELALASGVFIAALLAVVAAPGWRSAPGQSEGQAPGPGQGQRPGRLRRLRRLWRLGPPLAAALALPVAYQVFRMCYFALLEPNTGLAKAAGAAWWSQGLTYLWNFISPYTLWLPLLVVAPLIVFRAAGWWKNGDRLGVLVLTTPIAAGMVDLVYVVRVGGDYMHARLLLPAFFAILLPMFVTARQMRTVVAAPVVGVLIWAVICGGWLRYVPPKGSLNPQVIFISNERNNWITATGNPHPVTAADYARALSGKAGALLRQMAQQVPHGHQRLLVITDPYAPIKPSSAVPARSPLPFTLATDVPAIGVIGYLAGPDVYLFDDFSLANPIGSHTTITVHARPGHEKYIGPAWMVARFGVLKGDRAGGTVAGQSVADALEALQCDPLRSYLHAITAPMSISRAASNFIHSFSYTTMSFSADPAIAVHQLCGPAAFHTHP